MPGNLLTHVNPYTQRAYKDDPGLAWLSLINEGNLGNYLSLIKEIPDYQQAWNRWLVAQYRDRAGLVTAWGAILRDDEDPNKGSVRLDGDIYNQDLRAQRPGAFPERGRTRFLQTCREVSARRNWNSGPRDQHERLDQSRGHADRAGGNGLRGRSFLRRPPDFIERPWRLPSRCPNTSPVAAGASGGRQITFTRLFDRPFTLSEYDYSARSLSRCGRHPHRIDRCFAGLGVIWRPAIATTGIPGMQ